MYRHQIGWVIAACCAAVLSGFTLTARAPARAGQDFTGQVAFDVGSMSGRVENITVQVGDGERGPIHREFLFNAGWRFLRDSVAGAAQPTFDDSQWMEVDLPHDYSIMDLPGDDTPDQIGPFSRNSPGNGNATGHVLGGTGWYRKSFVLDGTDEGKTAILKFDGVYMESEVWVNGRLAGENRNGYTPFWFDITPLLNTPGEPNVVAVRVDNQGRNSRWYSGSGIYRNVHLLLVNPVHVGVWGARITTPTVNVNRAHVDLELTVVNERESGADAEITIHVKDVNGTLVNTVVDSLVLPAKAASISHKQFTVENPALWSPESPSLYRAEIIVETDNETSDVYEQTFGVRTIDISADEGLLLNGEPLLLKGGNLHHDNGLLGAAAYERAESRKVELMKANGFNAIRSAHNPPSEALLDACDSLGVLVIEEFTDMWESYKSPQDYSRFFADQWEKDLTNMILRDRNHPSVIMWSIGNEIRLNTVDDALRIGGQLSQRVRSLDGTRPVTEAVASLLVPGGWESTGPIFSLLDVSGYNYTNNKYGPDHDEYPQRIMYGSESFPLNAYEYWKAVEDNPYVIGDFVWSAMDYLGEVSIATSAYVPEAEHVVFQLPESLALPPGFNIWDWMQDMPSGWPAYVSWCGDLDITGDKKPQSLYRDVLWNNAAIAVNVHEYIPDGMAENISGWGWPREFPHWNWPGSEGELLQVRVFTKATEVRLLLNGQKIGEKTLTENDQYVAAFEVPYQAGELRAIAMENGVEVAGKTLRTPGRPAAIRLSADRSDVNADRRDLSFVTIEVVDDEGYVVPQDSVEIELSLIGNGELVASGNGSPYDMESVNRRIIRTYKGKAQAVIRPFDQPGEISVRAASTGLVPGEITLSVAEYNSTEFGT